MMKWLLFMMLVFFCVAPIVIAQADCPAIVSAALNTAAEECTGLERNEACYGNVTLEATARADTPTFTFEQAGDVVNVADIESLRLSSMSIADESWGVALMQLQANLPDSLPAQNITVLLFGNVNITNAAQELTEFEVSATANVNVRLRPTTSENNVIASLSVGQVVTANGRLEDGSWLRVVINAETGELGWVSSDFVSSETDLESLNVVLEGTPIFAPMQAFYFNSGIGDRPCAEAPDSGILIQTPEGVGEINLLINEVYIRLGSTVYLQAGNGLMRVSVVEGHAVLNSNGVSQTVPAGTYSEIPLDSSGLANGTPTFPQPYNYNDLLALPVSIALPQSVSVAPAVEENEVESAISIADGLPPNGRWSQAEMIVDFSAAACDLPWAVLNSVWNFTVTITFSEDRSSFTWLRGADSAVQVYTRTGDMTYALTLQVPGGSTTETWTFTSPTTFSTVTPPSADPNCYVSWTSTGSFNP